MSTHEVREIKKTDPFALKDDVYLRVYLQEKAHLDQYTK